MLWGQHSTIKYRLSSAKCANSLICKDCKGPHSSCVLHQAGILMSYDLKSWVRGCELCLYFLARPSLPLSHPPTLCPSLHPSLPPRSCQSSPKLAPPEAMVPCPSSSPFLEPPHCPGRLLLPLAPLRSPPRAPFLVPQRPLSFRHERAWPTVPGSAQSLVFWSPPSSHCPHARTPILAGLDPRGTPRER